MFYFRILPAGLFAAGMAVFLFSGCRSVSGSGRQSLLDEQTFLLTEVSDDASYGYIAEKPVKVGSGKESDGPKNELRYLNALTGPNGETVHYKKSGRCCAFKTRAIQPDGYGILTKYRITHEGRPDTVTLFLNSYDPGKMKAPQGFGIKKQPF